MFTDPLVVKVDKEAKTVTLSIRTTDNKVEVHKFPLSTFKKMDAEFQAQLKE